MSVRQVQVRAGQSNKTVVQYYFGSREGLIEAVIETRMAPVNRHRWKLLEQYDQDAPTQSLEVLTRAFIVPLAVETLEQQSSRYARFLLQAMVDPALGSRVQNHLNAGSFRAVYERLLAASGLQAAVARMRLRHVINLTAMTLSSWEGSVTTQAQGKAIVEDLIASCVAILRADPVNEIEYERGAFS